MGSNDWWRWLIAAAIVGMLGIGLFFEQVALPLKCGEATARYGLELAEIMGACPYPDR